MLRGASAAFPGRRAADTRPRPRREGGGRAEGGREGGKRGGQRPGWLGSDPRAAQPLPPRQGWAPRGPLPCPPTRVDIAAKHAHPRTLAGQPGSPRVRFLFGTHNRCLGNKASDRGHRRAQPPTPTPNGLSGRRSPRERDDGDKSGKYSTSQLLAWRGSGHSVAARSGEGPGSLPGAHLGAGRRGLCRWPRASGPDSLEATAPARPADQPSVPPFRPPEPARASTAALLGDGHSRSLLSALSLFCTFPPSLYSLFIPHNTGFHLI